MFFFSFSLLEQNVINVALIVQEPQTLIWITAASCPEWFKPSHVNIDYCFSWYLSAWHFFWITAVTKQNKCLPRLWELKRVNDFKLHRCSYHMTRWGGSSFLPSFHSAWLNLSWYLLPLQWLEPAGVEWQSRRWAIKAPPHTLTKICSNACLPQPPPSWSWGQHGLIWQLGRRMIIWRLQGAADWTDVTDDYSDIIVLPQERIRSLKLIHCTANMLYFIFLRKCYRKACWKATWYHSGLENCRNIQ